PEPAGMSSTVYDLAGDWAVGGFWDSDNNPVAARWNLRTGKFEVLSDVSGPLVHVNARGWTTDDVTVDLNGTTAAPGSPPGRDAKHNAGSSISDTGVIAGSTRDSHGQQVPVTWQC